MAEIIGADGFAILRAAYAPDALPEIAQVAAVETLRQIWVQQFCFIEDKIHWREAQELPPPTLCIHSPYDPDARAAKKRTTFWIGYKVHLSETCEPDTPHLITHVHTTRGPETDLGALLHIHQEMATQGRLPQVHFVDRGYISAESLHSSRQDHHVDLWGPTRDTYRWQGRDPAGYDISHFQINWTDRQAICPEGKTSSRWSDATDGHGKPVVKVGWASGNGYTGVGLPDQAFMSPGLRRLTCEQLLDSIDTAIGITAPRNYLDNGSTPLTRALGKPASRNEVSTARSDDVAVVQALELLNGEEFSSRVAAGKLAAELSQEKDPAQIVTQAYWSIYNRPPTLAELQTGSQFLERSTEKTGVLLGVKYGRYQRRMKTVSSAPSSSPDSGWILRRCSREIMPVLWKLSNKD